MQQTTDVAVLTANSPATDRRALSQAWYSALHLAERTPRAPAAPPRAQRTADALAAPAAPGAERAAPHAAPALQHPCAAHGERAARAGDAPAAERRAPPTELARRLERALAHHAPAQHAPHGTSASFALRAAGGRVRILVRSDGARTRVIAVCAPSLRERVERALAQARFALAGRGVRTEAA